MDFTDSRKPLKGAWMFACTVCLILACAPKKTIPPVFNNKEPLPIIDTNRHLPATIYFKNCDSVLAFLDWVVVNNREDRSISLGKFRFQYFMGTYHHFKKIFPDSCFIGMHARDFSKIFGDLDPGRVDSLTFASINTDKNGGLGLEVFFKDSLITKFTAWQYRHAISIW